MNTLSLIATIVGGLFLVVGGIAFTLAYLKSSLAKETIELQEKNRAALEERVKSLEESDATKTKKITALEGQIDTLKTLPLGKLAESYDTMAKTLQEIAATQKELLRLVPNSSPTTIINK